MSAERERLAEFLVAYAYGAEGTAEEVAARYLDVGEPVADMLMDAVEDAHNVEDWRNPEKGITRIEACLTALAEPTNAVGEPKPLDRHAPLDAGARMREMERQNAGRKATEALDRLDVAVGEPKEGGEAWTGFAWTKWTLVMHRDGDDFKFTERDIYNTEAGAWRAATGDDVVVPMMVPLATPAQAEPERADVAERKRALAVERIPGLIECLQKDFAALLATHAQTVTVEMTDPRDRVRFNLDKRLLEIRHFIGMKDGARSIRVKTIDDALACLRKADTDPPISLATHAGGPEATDWEVRRNEDGTVDEIVGTGFLHMEQMASDEWWFGLYTERSARSGAERLSWFVNSEGVTIQDVPARLAPTGAESAEPDECMTLGCDEPVELGYRVCTLHVTKMERVGMEPPRAPESAESTQGDKTDE